MNNFGYGTLLGSLWASIICGIFIYLREHRRQHTGVPTVPLTWEHHTFRRGHIELHAGVYGRGTITELALVCFGHNVTVDHLTISVSNQMTVLVRTLGDRFTAEEIAEIARYKPAGILLEFREAGETYGRCAWDVENDCGAAVMLEIKP